MSKKKQPVFRGFRKPVTKNPKAKVDPCKKVLAYANKKGVDEYFKLLPKGYWKFMSSRECPKCKNWHIRMSGKDVVLP